MGACVHSQADGVTLEFSDVDHAPQKPHSQHIAHNTHTNPHMNHAKPNLSNLQSLPKQPPPGHTLCTSSSMSTHAEIPSISSPQTPTISKPNHDTTTPPSNANQRISKLFANAHALSPIHDTLSTDALVISAFTDDNDEINDVHHGTGDDSDEALEAIKNSSASNDASQDTDIATETQPMLYSDERDDDELAEPQPQTSSNHIRQEHEHKQTDEDDAVDTTQMDPDTDDDDDEDDIDDPQPSTATRPTSMDELLTRTFQCVQSAVATQAGTSKGQAKTNQDSVIRMDAFGPSSAFQLYGVCDGHGPNGHDISQFVTEHLPAILHDHLTQQLSTLSIQQILQTTFASIDKKLQTQRALPFDINYSGTTATIGLFAGDVLYVANIGDSRTVLGQTPPSTVTKKKHVPVAVALSVDHDPKNRTEQSRILQKCQKSKSVTIVHDDEDESARIQIELPVLNETHPANGKTASPTSNPFLAAQNVNKNAAAAEEEDADAKPASFVRRISASVSRSLGDRMAHEYGGLISEPEVTVHRLCAQDVFVIFASDGIWQMIDNDDVMRSMGTKLQQHKNDVVYDDLESATQKLVREANIMWQDEFEDYTDDISCVIARVGQIKE